MNTKTTPQVPHAEPASERYPLDIENVGEDTYIVMSRGHHDVHEFMRKVREEGYYWTLCMPQHCWIKLTPTRNPRYHYVYSMVKEGVRGAIPATYAWESCLDDSYEALTANEQPEATP